MEVVLVRRCVLVFVWRLKKYHSRKAMEGGIKTQGRVLKAWLEAMQLKLPGCEVVMAATHLDTVAIAEAGEQDEAMSRFALAAVHGIAGWAKNARMTVARGGMSVLVGTVKGVGVSELRNEIMLSTVGTGLHLEEVPAAYLRLRELVVAARKEGYWLEWANYAKLAWEAGVKPDQLTMATRFLHGRGVLWYWGEPRRALVMPEEDLAEDHAMNTVFVSPQWLHSVVDCLYRRSRDDLITFFRGGPGANADMVKRVYVLMTAGVLHRDLVPYIWPSSGPGVGLWAKMRRERLGGGVWREDLVKGEADLQRVFLMLDKVRVMREVGSGGHFLVPHLSSGAASSSCSSRSVDDRSCRYGLEVVMPRLPQGLMGRLALEGLDTFLNVDFSFWASSRGGGVVTLYGKGDKTQMLFGPAKGQGGEEGQPSVHVVRLNASAPSALEAARACIEASLHSFPTLEEASSFGKVEEPERGVKPPFHIVMSHSFQSISYCEALQRELQARDPTMRVWLDQVPEMQKVWGQLSGVARDLLHMHGINTMDKLREMAFARSGWQKAGTVRIAREAMLRGGMLESDVQTMERLMNSPKKEAICVLLCVDDLYQHPTECDLRDVLYYASVGCPIIQVLMPSEMHPGGCVTLAPRLAATHEACHVVDLRSKSVWDDDGSSIYVNRRSGIDKSLLPPIAMVLEEWRGDLVVGHSPSGLLVPCEGCTAEGRHDMDFFDVREAWEVMREHNRARLRNLGKVADQPEPLECCWGHREDPRRVVSGQVPIRAVACPACIAQCTSPPYPFGFWHCLEAMSWVDASLEQSQRRPVGPRSRMSATVKTSLAAKFLTHNIKLIAAPAPSLKPALQRRDSEFFEEVSAHSNLHSGKRGGGVDKGLVRGGSKENLRGSAPTSPRGSKQSDAGSKGQPAPPSSPPHKTPSGAGGGGGGGSASAAQGKAAQGKAPSASATQGNSAAQGKAPHPPAGGAQTSPRKATVASQRGKAGSQGASGVVSRPQKGGYPITWRTKAEKRAGFVPKSTFWGASGQEGAVHNKGVDGEGGGEGGGASLGAATSSQGVSKIKGMMNMMRGKVFLGEVQRENAAHVSRMFRPTQPHSPPHYSGSRQK